MWLVRCVGVLLALLCVGMAHAAIEQREPTWGGNYSGKGASGKASADEVCAAIYAQLPGYSFAGLGAMTGTKPTRSAGCRATTTTQSSPFNAGTATETCGGWSWNAARQMCERTVSQCTPPLVADAQGICVPDCVNKIGKAVSSGYVTVQGGSKPPGSMCKDLCSYENIGGGWISGVKNGKYFHTTLGSNMVANGQSCTPSPTGSDNPTNPEPRPEPLKPGQCPGTVNGVSVVVDCDSSTSNGPKETTKPTTTTPPPANGGDPANGPPGSKNTDKSTTCTGATCTTTETTTTTNPDGSTTEDKKETEESKNEFCEKNPASLQCEKSSFSGSCGAFTCGGDAIQCAIAKEQHTRNCELFAASEASARGLAAATAGDRPGDHPRNGITSVSMANGFDQTNLLSGSCPGDQTIPIGGGKSVVLPWSKLCEPAAMLGNVLVGITALACLGIVFKG